MASEKRLIDADALVECIKERLKNDTIIRWLCCIVNETPTVDAVEVARLGKLGRLMKPYRGCGRGRVGPSGCVGNFKPMELDPIEDIEGDRWVPVLEDDLSLLKAKANNAVEVVRCKNCQSSHYNECSGLTKCTSQRGLHRIVDPNEHCSWGERKDNEEQRI